jgi:hypothetical protein
MIEIPEGALTETKTFSITTYLSNSSLPSEWFPIPGFVGAVDVGPDGLIFNKPVKITIPLNTPMTPGETIPLFYWDSNSQTWQQTGVIATVGADGTTFTAEVDHFSGYGGSSFSNLLNSGNASQFMSDFIDWYNNDPNMKHIGDKNAKNNTCFEVVGIALDLKFEINGQKGGDYALIGRTSSYPESPLVMIDYNIDITNGYSYNASITLTLVIYNDCTSPDLKLEANPTTLAEGETSEIRATLTCDGTPMTGKEVNFTIKSGPGEVNPGLTTTNSSGVATTTFTAGDKDSVVNAYNDSCQANKSVTKDITIKVIPDQFNLSIAFDQTTVIDDYFDEWSYSGSVIITVSNFQGGSGDLQGSNTFDVNGSGASGDCTMVTFGTVTFTITGTLTVPQAGQPQLNLTVSPNFDTYRTIDCPDDPPLTFPYIIAGEPSSFTIPMENGYTIETTLPAGPIVSHIIYVLTY